MSKRKTVILEEPEEQPTKQEEIEQEKEIKEQREIQEWVTDFQSHFTNQPAKILIEKFENSEWSICRRYPLSTFDHEMVRIEFGGGTYRAVLIDPKGRYVPEGRNTFKFAESIIKTEVMKPAPNPLSDPATLMVIESLKGQQAQMMEIAKLMIASAQGGSQKGNDIGQLIIALKGIQELTPKDQKPMEAFKDTLNMMKLVKDVTGDGESKSGGLLSEIREFMEIWPTIKEQIPALKPGAPTPIPQVPPPAINPSERTTPVLDPVSAKIVENVPKFIEAAKKSQPIEDWANNLLDIIDDEMMPLLLPLWKKVYGPLVQNEEDVYDILLRYSKDPTERDKIFKEIPPLAPYKEWMNRVILEAIRLVETETETPENVVVHAVTGNGHTPIE